MEEKPNRIKSKRLKTIRLLMYLDVLLMLLSVLMIDVPNFSLIAHFGICLRILVLLAVFIVLLVSERSLSRYLRKHRTE